MIIRKKDTSTIEKILFLFNRINALYQQHVTVLHCFSLINNAKYNGKVTFI